MSYRSLQNLPPGEYSVVFSQNEDGKWTESAIDVPTQVVAQRILFEFNDAGQRVDLTVSGPLLHGEASTSTRKNSYVDDLRSRIEHWIVGQGQDPSVARNLTNERKTLDKIISEIELGLGEEQELNKISSEELQQLKPLLTKLKSLTSMYRNEHRRLQACIASVSRVSPPLDSESSVVKVSGASPSTTSTASFASTSTPKTPRKKRVSFNEGETSSHTLHRTSRDSRPSSLPVKTPTEAFSKILDDIEKELESLCSNEEKTENIRTTLYRKLKENPGIILVIMRNNPIWLASLDEDSLLELSQLANLNISTTIALMCFREIIETESRDPINEIHHIQDKEIKAKALNQLEIILKKTKRIRFL